MKSYNLNIINYIVFGKHSSGIYGKCLNIKNWYFIIDAYDEMHEQYDYYHNSLPQQIERLLKK